MGNDNTKSKHCKKPFNWLFVRISSRIKCKKNDCHINAIDHKGDKSPHVIQKFHKISEKQNDICEKEHSELPEETECLTEEWEKDWCECADPDEPVYDCKNNNPWADVWALDCHLGKLVTGKRWWFNFS